MALPSWFYGGLTACSLACISPVTLADEPRAVEKDRAAAEAQAAQAEAVAKDYEAAAARAAQTKAKAEAAAAEDSAFARRVVIDLTGKPPTDADVQLFVESRDPQKRQNWLNRWTDQRTAQPADNADEAKSEDKTKTARAAVPAAPLAPKPAITIQPLQLSHEALKRIHGDVQWEAAVPAPAPFWIGVECHPLEAVVRQALKLPEDTGIIVARVSENSPASKAGLKPGDILRKWRINNEEATTIKDVDALVTIVQEHGAKFPEQAATVEITRAGEELKLLLKPSKRELTTLKIPAAGTTAGGTTLGGTFAGGTFAVDPQQLQQSVTERLQRQMQLDSARSSLEYKLAEARAKFEEGKARYDAAQAKLEDTRKRVDSATEPNSTLVQAESELRIMQAQIALAQTQVQHAEAHLKQYQDWTKAMMAHGFQIPSPGATNFDVLIPAPGIITDRVTRLELPEDVRVTIVHEGKKPARITVERGGKLEVTTEKTKDLPAEVRSFVEQMLTNQPSKMLKLFHTQGNEGPGRVELRVPEGERTIMTPGLPIAPPRVVIHATPQLQALPATPATQKQIDELQKALEQLRKQVEQMEKK